MQKELVERFVESLLTNADDLSVFLHPDIELRTLLDGVVHSGKPPVLAVLRRTAESTLHVDEWRIVDQTDDAVLVKARFVGRLPSNVVQRFDVVWRITLERGLIRGIYPYTDEETARASISPSAWTRTS